VNPKDHSPLEQAWQNSFDYHIEEENEMGVCLETKKFTTLPNVLMFAI